MMSEVRPPIRLCRPDIGPEELDAIAGVLGSGVLTNGPRTIEFENMFSERHGCEHGIAFANGTVALEGLYLALGIGAGDEVITPSMTFISTATSILHVGATPVFADVEPDTFNIDPADVARKITNRTKAVVAVHYGGQSADLSELNELTDGAGVYLLEDAAEAHGAEYKGRPVGSWGLAGMFSFTPTKNVTTGEGGLVTTNDAQLADKLRLLRNHGQRATYEHVSLGYNWRITEIQAAMGIEQIRKLDAILERKRRNAKILLALLESNDRIRPPLTKDDRDHVFMLFTLLIHGERDDVMRRLGSQGIETKLYFPPAHSQPVFEGFTADLPVTEELAKRMLSVPFHSMLTSSDLERIAAALSIACDIDAGVHS